MEKAEWVAELKAQLEDSDNLTILLANSDGHELEITDIRFEDNQIVMTVE